MPTNQQILDCAEFLGQLTQWGAPMGNLRAVEEAYSVLLTNRAPTPYDQVSPFSLNGTPDIERIAPMLQQLGSVPWAQEAEDCFWELAWWASGSSTAGDRNDEARIKARQMSFASLWCVAVVVFLALKAGVYESNKKALTALVIETAR